MPLLPSLPDPARLGDLLMAHKDHSGPLLAYIDSVMRGPGPLDVATRELIAAYVSGLNACAFCHGSHRIYAEALGVEAGVVEALLTDIDSAPIDDRLKPFFHYAKKLNTLPSRLVSADAEAAFSAGWDETALMQVIHIVGVFNLMNRLVEGAGVNFDYDGETANADDLSSSYSDFARRLGVAE